MEDPSIILENNRIAGLEAQILSSQESLIRANRELDSALLRITTLENVCLENQTDLHEKRTRISELNDQITEYEQTNEHLIEELNDKNEKIENLNAIITQLKEHIKQKNDEYTPDIPFNQQLRELILTDHSFSFNSPEDLLHQYQHHQRSKFHDLLQESLITEDISQLIDSDDILFELFIHLNSLNRLKETLSRDSKHLQDIRSFLHLSIEYEDQSLQDLVNKRECMEYLRSKIEIDDPMSDLELVKYVLHDYFDYQQQKMEFKEYLQIHSEENSTWRILIERCERANHIEQQLNQFISEYSNSSITQQEPLDTLRGIIQTRMTSPVGNQLNEFIQSLGEDEGKQLERIRSSIDLHRNLREKFHTDQTILQQIDDYQSIVNTLQSPDHNWTTEECINRIQTMKYAEGLRDQSINQQKELQEAIANIVNEYEEQLPSFGSDLTRIHQFIQSLLEKSEEKQDAEIQTTMDTDDLSQQIQEVLEIEDVNSEAMIEKIKEMRDQSRMYSEQDQQLRTIFQSDDENIIESAMKLTENYHRLSSEHEELLDRLMKKIGLSSSDSSSETQIDELCNLLDTFYLESSQLISANNLIEIVQQIPLIYTEYNQFKTLIQQIASPDTTDNLSKLRTYITQVDNLCQLIGNGPISIDQALHIYQTKLQEFNDRIHKATEFQEELLKHLSIDNIDQIFTRLDELNHPKTASLVSEQQLKLAECEDTLEKLRSQRERMLNKMKDIKINNETLTTQLNESEQSLDQLHREKVDLQNQLDNSEQELRRIKNQNQMNTDDYQSQVDLQETMKLELESLKHELDKQKKLYENRCRQILNEKKQLEKNLQQSLDDKLLIEEKNEQTQALIQTIKDSLENIDDVYSIVDGIIQLQQDLLILQQRIEQLQIENGNLLSNVNQQENTIKESMQIKNDLEKRVIDAEQQISHSKRQFDEHSHQYEKLKREYQIYREDHPIETKEQIAIIDIQQSPPSIQQVPEPRNWTAIEMKDEEIPSPLINKHLTMDASTALLNLLGELKSKLGITLTHRPRSSSVFFLYLCAVHLLTFYSLFIRHC